MTSATLDRVTRRGFVPASVLPIEVREAKGLAGIVSGYGAVFFSPSDPGTRFMLWDDLEERIVPGAFDRAIREDDVRGLVNHDANLLLGRTKAGTMRLSVDAKGLRYEVDVPDTSAGRDAVTSIKRGDMDGSSFSFNVTDEEVRKEMKDGKTTYIREIRGVMLYDVGPVTFPAYEATTSDARAEARSKADALKASESAAAEEALKIESEARARTLDLKRRRAL